MDPDSPLLRSRLNEAMQILGPDAHVQTVLRLLQECDLSVERALMRYFDDATSAGDRAAKRVQQSIVESAAPLPSTKRPRVRTSLDADGLFSDLRNSEVHVATCMWVGHSIVRERSPFGENAPVVFECDGARDVKGSWGFSRSVTSTIRFRPARAVTCVGKLPKELCDILFPLVDARLVRLVGNVLFAPPKLEVFSEIILNVEIHVAGKAFADSEAMTLTVTQNPVQIALYQLLHRVMFGASESSIALPDARTPQADAKLDEDDPALAATEAQIDSLVARPQRARALPLAAQPARMAGLSLRPYQQQALAWMLDRERNEKRPARGSSGRASTDRTETEEISDDWDDDFAVPLSATADGGTQHPTNPLWNVHKCADGRELYVNQYARIVAVKPPPPMRPCRGGILADEMGMGKTIEMLALILAQQAAAAAAPPPPPPTAAAAPPPRADSPFVIELDDDGEPIVVADTSMSSAMTAETGRSLGSSPGLHSPVGEPSPGGTRSVSGPVDANQTPVLLRLDNTPEVLTKINATLVVAPMSLIGQWCDELTNFSSPKLKVLQHYSNTRLTSVHELENADVVVTTYGMLVSEMQNACVTPVLSSGACAKITGSSPIPSAMYRVHWRRIVLDEAHTIKNRATGAAQAAFCLSAETRWCLTGTPIQNSLEDLYSLFRFLQHQPWCEHSWWKRVISEPYARQDPAAMVRLKSVLKPVILRRTKDMVDVDGTKIVTLPPKTIQDMWVDLSERESAFYNALYTRSKCEFDGLLATGSVMMQYAAVLTLLLRLRQACVHPMLALGASGGSNIATQFGSEPPALSRTSPPSGGGAAGSGSSSPPAVDEDEDEASARSIGLDSAAIRTLYQQFMHTPKAPALPAYVREVLDGLQRKGIAAHECPICLESPQEPVLTPCAHLMCHQCLRDTFNKDDMSRLCPVCRKPFPDSSIVYINRLINAAPAAGPSTPSSPTADSPQMSTKLKALVRELRIMAKANADNKASNEAPVKAVIFSQWTGMLNLVGDALNREGMPFVRLDGAMSKDKRQLALRLFNTEPKYEIFLMSLKAGSLGLNVTAASVVYLLDPWWNPAVEEQAINRVHRLGQTRPVTVKRILAANTVETTLLELQERKRGIAQSALDGASLGDANKLSLDDLKRFFR